MGTSVTPQQEPLDISKVLYALFQDVIGGTAHLNAAKGIFDAEKSHSVIMTASPSFFRLTKEAHLEAAQFAAARLFDENKDSVGIPWLLKQTTLRRKEFRDDSESELDQAIEEAQQTCAALEAIRSRLKCRRDRILAHLDKKTIRYPEKIERDAELRYLELKGLLKSADVILNTIADLHGDVGFLIFDDDYDDLSRTLDLIVGKGPEPEPPVEVV